MFHLKTLAKLLMGPLLVIALPSLALRHCRGYWELMRSWEVGTSSAVEAEIRLAEPRSVRRVVLGSSVALTDVDERLLDRLLGEPEGSTLNLGIKGEAAAVSSMLMPEVLMLSPEAVLFVVHSENLCSWGGWKEFGTGGGRGVPPSTIYDSSVAWHVFPRGSFVVDRGYHLAGALGSASLLVRHRLDLRYVASKLLLHRGARPVGRDPKRVPRLAEWALKKDLAAARRDLSFPVDGPNARSLCYAAEACAKAGVRLIVVPAPDHPGVRGAAHNPSLESLLAQLQRRCSLEVLPSRTFREFRDPDFIDHHHMSREGRLYFTARVAEYLKAAD